MKTIAEMFKDLKFDEERPVYTKAMDEAMDDVIFTIENSSNDQFDKVLKRFLSKDVLKQLEDLEETQGLNPKDVTRRHIELALEIGDYYRNLNFRHFGQKTFNQQNVFFGPQSSIFEFICDLLSALRTTISVDLHIHASRSAQVKLICQEIITAETKYKFDLNLKEINHYYCTLLLTESGDLDSATDFLSAACRDNTSLWKLRNVLVQDSVQDKFLALVKTKLRSFPESFFLNPDFVERFNDALSQTERMGLESISNDSIPSSVRPTLVLGARRSTLDSANTISPVLTLNTFRTVKEGISLLNAEHGGSVSIWANQLATAYEIAHSCTASTIWINCYEKFNRAVPFSFRAGGFNYGGDLGVLDRLVKVRSHVVDGSPKEVPTKFHKINELFESVITKLRSMYVTVAVNDNHHFECISEALSLDDFYLFIDEKVYSKSLQLMYKKDSIDEVCSNKMANLLFNQLKTICFSFGESFAN